jgi:integrase
MNVSEASERYLDYHRLSSKKDTAYNYEFLLSRFCTAFGDRELNSLTTDEIYSFLTQLTEGNKKSTRRLRFSLLTAFFNFVRNTIDPDTPNPCDSPIMKKSFRVPKPNRWKILEKEIVDEMIYRTTKPRDRLLLELMARGGMRIGEVVKLKPVDILERKLIIRDPKSGKESEVVFIPQKLTDRLKEYVRDEGIQENERIFRLSTQGAREIVKRAARLVGVNVRPHDLRRFAATYASRSGTPLEIVSKVILRHADLQTTQLYLGKVSDEEAMRWIDNLHA